MTFFKKKLGLSIRGLLLNKLFDTLNSHQKTLLCVGPLSTNIIDVAVEFAESKCVPLVLVASRRQIECKELGGGYVNSWSTEDFMNYVRSKKSQYIYIERDHGGPWQGNYEISKKLNTEESMRAAKMSYEADIDAGVQILHIDPTIPICNENLSFTTIVSRLFELYGHVVEYARVKGKRIAIELGTEEQTGSYTDLGLFEEFLERTDQFCRLNKFENPLFVVIQTGAKVIENRNVGVFELGNKFDKSHLIKNIQDSVLIAKKYNIHIKEHNSDYLSFENLSLRPNIGIRAANIAPEFGYIETKALLYLLNNFGNKNDYDQAMQIIIDSKKWEKWVMPDSSLKRIDKAYIAGHYCYSNPVIFDIKNRLAFDLLKRGINLDENLKKVIRSSFYKYASAFGLL